MIGPAESRHEELLWGSPSASSVGDMGYEDFGPVLNADGSPSDVTLAMFRVERSDFDHLYVDFGGES